MANEAGKQAAARAALDYIRGDMVIGVGSGSTVHYFIDALASIKSRIEGAVASSEETAKRLRALSIPVVDLNSAGEIQLYIDGADEVNDARQMIKGGGGALTREKIIATASKKMICIVDETKVVDLLASFLSRSRLSRWPALCGTADCLVGRRSSLPRRVCDR